MANGNDQSQGASRRKFTRVPVNLPGYVRVGGNAPVACTVRDYCPGGMFIAPDSGSFADLATPAKAELLFALIVDGEQRDLSLNLMVVRAADQGMGVSFVEPDPLVLESLRQLADSVSHADAATGDSTALDGTLSGFAPEHAALREPLKQAVEAPLTGLGERFFKQACDALFVAARDAGSNVEERQFLDAQRQMLALSARVKTQFIPDLQGGVEILGNPVARIEQPSSLSLESSGLSLIDKGDFEDFLAISEAAAELEARFKDALFDLGARLSHLAKREVTLSNNPLGPSALCNLLAGLFKEIDADHRVKTMVYRELKGTLHAELGAIYDQLNGFLAGQGILPDVVKEQPDYRPRPSADVGFSVSGNARSRRPEANAFAEEALDDLMPGPENYDGSAVPASLEPADFVAPSASVRAVRPAAPPGAQPLSSASPVPAEAPLSERRSAAAEPSVASWDRTPVTALARTAPRVHSAVQAQLALRRQIREQPQGPVLDAAAESSLGGVTEGSGQRAIARVSAGLLNVQRNIAADASSGDEAHIDSLVQAALAQADAADEALNADDADAMEVVGNLFSAMMDDELVATSAKAQLAQLRPASHRAALLDPEFFASNQHPVRQVINRVSRIRGGNSPDQVERRARVQGLLEQVNKDFVDDVRVFEPVSAALDAVLSEQENAFQDRLSDIVRSCDEQQRILDNRRVVGNVDAQAADTEKADTPEEWHRWLERADRLKVGDRVIINAKSPRATPGQVAWKEATGKLFVFVDDAGNKASTLTRQQVAMYLRRGLLRVLGESADAPGVDRAMLSVVDRVHKQVESDATKDPLSGYLARRFFEEAVEKHIQDADPAAGKNLAMCYVSLENLRDVNDKMSESVGDSLLKEFAEELTQRLAEEPVICGRLSGSILALFWKSGGTAAAHKKLRASVEMLRELSVGVPYEAMDEGELAHAESETQEIDHRRVSPVFVIGIAGSEDNAVDAEGLISAAREACDHARESAAEPPIHVTGSESEQRAQLERMIAYADKALEKDRLTLSGQKISSLTDERLPPALSMTLGAVDRSQRRIPEKLITPALKRCSQLAAYDRWALRRAFEWVLANEELADRYAMFVLPLSRAAIENEELPNELIGEFMESPVQPGQVCFSLPDQAVVDNQSLVSDLVDALKAYGCRFILEDFGSGHDSYDYIKSIDTDFVEIRTSFIEDADKNPRDLAMAKSINELAHFLGKKTIGRQHLGKDLAETMRAIGIDFMHQQAGQVEIVKRT